MLDVADLMRTDAQGRGIVNVLAADKLMQAPRLYAIFLLWLLGDLYESCRKWATWNSPSWSSSSTRPICCSPMRRKPADQDRAGGPPGPIKGVGVYFVTQNPLDIPIRCWGSWATASSTRCAPSRRATRRPSRRGADHAPNPGLDIEAAITELGVGEALVSLLDAKGGRPPSAPGSCRRPAASGRPPMPSARRCVGPIPCRQVRAGD